MTAPAAFTEPISAYIWETKYRATGPRGREPDVEATWRRVARAIARAEPPGERRRWAVRFYELLRDFKFLPGGRILAGAGTHRRVTLLNCFVMGVIEDSLDGIFGALREGALTMQAGGGVGYDFSTLRPAGTPARTTGTIASGPVSFMQVWDAMCQTIQSTGARRGAMMGVLRCDHPDVERFVEAKAEPGRLTCFNLSVGVTDAFMRAVLADEPWPLVFPEEAFDGGAGEVVQRNWTGTREPVPCRIVRTVSARRLWDRIMRATYDHAEPGVLFLDTINRRNNLYWFESITATNPCGEIPLPPYGSCDLGSLNLAIFVREPFTPRAYLDWEALAAAIPVAVRFLDDVLEVSRFPLRRQRREALATRRIGLGITGLADALVMLGRRYDDPETVAWVEGLAERFAIATWRASVALAQEKGAFPRFEREPYLEGELVRQMPTELRDAIARWGIRNSHHNAIAPTGTISLLANNVSSGIEPIFAGVYERWVRLDVLHPRRFEVHDAALRAWREAGHTGEPPAWVTATEIAPRAHLAMAAAWQHWVDNAISKTIHVPESYPFEAFRDVYRQAWELGLKGCTTYRPNPVTGTVLELHTSASPAGRHCCTLERETD